MQVEPLTRRFYYLGLELPDLDPRLTPEQVRDSYGGLYPEITTATIEDPEHCPYYVDLSQLFWITTLLSQPRSY